MYVHCDIGDDDVMFEFRVTAVTTDEDGLSLRGETSEVLKYEMCSPVPGMCHIVNCSQVINNEISINEH